jgi:thioredoxin 1
MADGMFQRGSILAVVLVLAGVSVAQWVNAPLKIPEQRNPNLYRADANAHQEIAESLVQARKDGKRVLLVFGANWCGDCYALDYAFHQPRIAPLLDANFKVVHVDIGQNDKNLDVAKKYHVDPEKGVPSLAVLSSRGGLLYSTKEFDRARMMTEQDVIQFLTSWKPPATPQK